MGWGTTLQNDTATTPCSGALRALSVYKTQADNRQKCPFPPPAGSKHGGCRLRLPPRRADSCSHELLRSKTSPKFQPSKHKDPSCFRHVSPAPDHRGTPSCADVNNHRHKTRGNACFLSEPRFAFALFPQHAGIYSRPVPAFILQLYFCRSSWRSY